MRISRELAAVVTAAEQVVAADRMWGEGSQHSTVSRQAALTAITTARRAGHTDTEIQNAVAHLAFQVNR